MLCTLLTRDIHRIGIKDVVYVPGEHTRSTMLGNTAAPGWLTCAGSKYDVEAERIPAIWFGQEDPTTTLLPLVDTVPRDP